MKKQPYTLQLYPRETMMLIEISEKDRQNLYLQTIHYFKAELIKRYKRWHQE